MIVACRCSPHELYRPHYTARVIVQTSREAVAPRYFESQGVSFESADIETLIQVLR